ncbi:MAG: hypothetical protein ACFB21_12390 [Opitutales bacterium]
MFSPSFYSFLVSLLVLTLAGCGYNDVREVDADDPEIAPTLGGSARDLDRVTSELIAQMLNSPTLAAIDPDVDRAIMRIGRITDDTLTNFPVREMVNKIRIDLNRSNRILTQEQDLAGPNAPRPDFEIRGQVSQVNNQAGRDTRVDYFIQLRLVDLESGIAVWEGESYYTRLADSGVTW